MTITFTNNVLYFDIAKVSRLRSYATQTIKYDMFSQYKLQDTLNNYTDFKYLAIRIAITLILSILSSVHNPNPKLYVICIYVYIYI